MTITFDQVLDGCLKICACLALLGIGYAGAAVGDYWQFLRHAAMCERLKAAPEEAGDG